MFDRGARLARLFGDRAEVGTLQMLSDLLDALPIGAALYDASDDAYRVSYVNKTVERQFATDSASLIGKPVVEAFGPAALDFIDGFGRVRRSGRPWRIAEYVPPQGSNRFLVEACPVPEQPNPRFILSWWQDVTEQVAARHRAETALELALDVAKPLRSAESLGRLARRAAEETRSEVVAVAGIHSDRLIVEASHGLDSGATGAPRVVALGDVPLATKAVESARPVAGPMAGQPGAGVLLDVSRRDAELAVVPLLADGAPVGLLLLGRVEGPPFGEHELLLLELIGGHVALAVQHARTADRLRLGVDMAIGLAAQLEPVECIRTLLKMAVQAMGGRATLSRVTGRELIVVDSYSEDLPAFPVGTRWRRADYPLMNLALETGLPQTGDENRDPAFFPADIEIVAVPLQLGGNPFATLGLSRKHVPFTADDLVTLKLVGSVAALALRNADLFEELRETGRARTNLMNLVAHELRRPLSVISAYLSMLDEGSITTEPERVRVLLAKVDESNDLVDRLLMAARLEAGVQVGAGRERVDLRSLAEAARDRLSPRAGMADATVELDLPDQPVYALTDPGLVGTILDNLAANAVIYGGSRPVVGISVSQQGGRALITVRDNGRGIPPEKWEIVFDEFTRLEDAGTSGTGLGLFISRRLADALDGTIEIVESGLDTGTEIRLSLPLETTG